ncbi:WD40 repeat-like protein [Laetiporus sulphureus 93-53]|uniref:WD40 repeat-like protein n=1 Tax=Laetiporus sulphureus 93-53 TaxID=1314785 RepID=A0A165CBB9_9APHY|nr:WD40 repeat-like protein [Laetiporus sulphureus 93-53]KZT02499.1 WD40 repeat-like protein [Laetiporus sulphureus 93-53]
MDLGEDVYENSDADDDDEAEDGLEFAAEGVEEDEALFNNGLPHRVLRVSPQTISNDQEQSTVRVGNISLGHLQRLLGIRISDTSRRIYDDGDMGRDDEDEDWELDAHARNPHWDRSTWFSEVKEPKAEGLELLRGGQFGRLGHQINSRNKNNSIAKLLLNRATRSRPIYREDITSDLLPNSRGTAVAVYAANAYVGQYSSDSSFYYTCVRDFRLHVYDTTAPLEINGSQSPRRDVERQYGHATTMKVIKTIKAAPGRWTITDSHLSPDNQRIIYASMSSTVYMTTTLDSSPVQVPIQFADPVRSRRGIWDYDDDLSIWSCKFSADGNEVVAGGSGMIFVYDLLADQRTVKIRAHGDDVNSCCWADTASGNVLISASDDTFIKVWDRRSLGTSQKPSGVLIGHTEGITYVSAKGDGRYIISNGKDQVLRLWDLRMMRSNEEYEKGSRRSYGIPNFDYRGGTYSQPRFRSHPQDCSVMQYTGHEVLRTLIRCHFSPAETTGQQYIYSGGSDGRIHIWSLDGRVLQVIDRTETLPMSSDPSGPEPSPLPPSARKTRVCVRDVSWHSEQPIMMSTGWLGGHWSVREGSIVARHEWKGMSKRGGTLEDWVERKNAEADERGVKRRDMMRKMPGGFSVLLCMPHGKSGAWSSLGPPSSSFRLVKRVLLTPAEAAANSQIAPMDADLHTYGFPAGYFIIRSAATNRVMDVEMSWVEDGTNVILYTETETSLVESMRKPDCDNQVFFIDTSGALCSRSSGHAIDVEDGRLVVRHRRPVVHPFPNSYSHPLPRFSHDRQTHNINVTFAMDPSNTTSTSKSVRRTSVDAWKEKVYLLSSIPARKPRTVVDDASEMFTNAIASPLTFFGSFGKTRSGATPENVFSSGDIDLREDEILEQDRTEEGEVDDSPEKRREVRVLTLAKEELDAASEKAKLRRRWIVTPIRLSKNHTSTL